MNPLLSVRRAAVGLLFTASLFLITGCGGGTTASGKVTFDDQPIDGGTVSFLPTDAVGGKTHPVSAEIKEGKYLVDATKDLQPGKYRVEIYWHKKTGKQIMSSDPPNKIDETKQVVPKKYNVDSKTEVDVQRGSNTFDFKTTSK